jgi:hypothetical protein
MMNWQALDLLRLVQHTLKSIVLYLREVKSNTTLYDPKIRREAEQVDLSKWLFGQDLINFDDQLVLALEIRSKVRL